MSYARGCACGGIRGDVRANAPDANIPAATALSLSHTHIHIHHVRGSARRKDSEPEVPNPSSSHTLHAGIDGMRRSLRRTHVGAHLRLHGRRHQMSVEDLDLVVVRVDGALGRPTRVCTWR
eukprot:7375884-Prymnesium_polylepis.4